MLIVKEDVAIFGVSELRTRTADVVEEIKKRKVILTKRNKPVGVIIGYEEYETLSALFEEVEDVVLAGIAEKRLKRKGKKSVTLEEAEKKVGLK